MVVAVEDDGMHKAPPFVVALQRRKYVSVSERLPIIYNPPPLDDAVQEVNVELYRRAALSAYTPPPELVAVQPSKMHSVMIDELMTCKAPAPPALALQDVKLHRVMKV